MSLIDLYFFDKLHKPQPHKNKNKTGIHTHLKYLNNKQRIIISLNKIVSYVNVPII